MENTCSTLALLCEEEISSRPSERGSQMSARGRSRNILLWGGWEYRAGVSKLQLWVPCFSNSPAERCGRQQGSEGDSPLTHAAAHVQAEANSGYPLFLFIWTDKSPGQQRGLMTLVGTHQYRCSLSLAFILFFDWALLISYFNTKGIHSNFISMCP